MNLFLTKSLFRLNPTIALAMYVPPELHEVTYFKSLSCANISISICNLFMTVVSVMGLTFSYIRNGGNYNNNGGGNLPMDF